MISSKFWFSIIKILIFGVFLIFLIHTFNQKTHLPEVIKQELSTFIKTPLIFLSILTLSLVNWLIEIKKWQVLVSSFKKIAFIEATIQSLTAHSIALFTPYKTGDFVWKLLYFNKSDSKKILYLNSVNNLSVAVFTYSFGFLSIIYLFSKGNLLVINQLYQLVLIILIVSLLIMILGYLSYPYLKKLIEKLQINGLIDYKSVGLLALLKYLVFSHQFYILLVFYDVPLPYSIAISGIFSVYIISSLFPILSIADVVVKGSVAILIFSQLNVEPEIIITVTTLLWLFNFIFPSLIGGIMILTNNTKDWKLILKKTTA